MKCLVIGDPHFKVSSIALVRKFVEWIHQMVELHQPDFVVNLGDTFHTHNVIRSEIMAVVAAHVKWMEMHTEYYVLVGNHDMAHHKTPEIHAWLPFIGLYDFIHVIAKPLCGNGLGFMPYFDDPESFLKCYAEFLAKGVKTIFCHQTFLGADYGFMTSKDGVPVPVWPDGEIVSGHVHKAQQMGPVWYPGTPYAQEATDSNMTKGIYLYDLDTRVKEFLPSPLPQWITRKATVSNYLDVVASMRAEDRNHLVLEGPGPELNALLETKAFKDLKTSVGFSVKKDSTTVTKSAKTLKRATTIEDAVVEYIDKLYDGAVDKDKLKDKCLSALR